MTRLLPAFVILICISACKKDNDKPSLVGKWKQTESFDARPSIGCFCWSTVNEMGATKYEFKSNGNYTSTPPIYSALAVCQGTWRIVNDSTLAMTNCGTTTETLHWFKREGNTLTIAYEYSGANFKSKFEKVRAF